VSDYVKLGDSATATGNHDRHDLRRKTTPGNLVLTHDPAPDYDVFKFRRFRLNLITFLKLPLGISESSLRDAIKGCSVNLLEVYVARAERAHRQYSGPSTRRDALEDGAPTLSGSSLFRAPAA
jgi:hypothetical protein